MKRMLQAAIVILAASFVHEAIAEDVDLSKFTQEIQLIEQGNGGFLLIWWVPTEYWKESFKNEKSMTQAQKDEFYKRVEKYTVFFVIDAKIGDFGKVTPLSQQEIVKKVRLSVGKEKNLKPLGDEDIDVETKAFFGMIKPVVANMLGAFGKGMEFVCFKGENEEGKRLLDPMKEGRFRLKYGEKSHIWRLPLGTLLPPKYDPKTHEKFPGNYAYNPFTGTALVSTPPKKEAAEETP